MLLSTRADELTGLPVLITWWLVEKRWSCASHNLSRIRSDKGLYHSGQGSKARFGCPEDEMDTFPKGNHIVLTGDSFFGMNVSLRDQTCIPLPSLENSSPLANCYLVGGEGVGGGGGGGRGGSHVESAHN